MPLLISMKPSLEKNSRDLEASERYTQRKCKVKETRWPGFSILTLKATASKVQSPNCHLLCGLMGKGQGSLEPDDLPGGHQSLSLQHPCPTFATHPPTNLITFSNSFTCIYFFALRGCCMLKHTVQFYLHNITKEILC